MGRPWNQIKDLTDPKQLDDLLKWLQEMEMTSWQWKDNKVTLFINSVAVVSIDVDGNTKLKGSISEVQSSV